MTALSKVNFSWKSDSRVYGGVEVREPWVQIVPTRLVIWLWASPRFDFLDYKMVMMMKILIMSPVSEAPEIHQLCRVKCLAHSKLPLSIRDEAEAGRRLYLSVSLWGDISYTRSPTLGPSFPVGNQNSKGRNRKFSLGTGSLVPLVFPTDVDMSGSYTTCTNLFSLSCN